MANEGAEQSRPRVRVELALGLLVFAYYLLVSSLMGSGREARAIRHAEAVYDVERALWLDVEPWFNRVLHPHRTLVTLANYEYATTYVISALALIIWLMLRRPEQYRAARNSFLLLNVVAITCFALWPTAPPRLVPGQGFVDTVRLGQTWGSWGSPVGDHANQLAAMPSLHFAWAVWVSVVLAWNGHRWWLQAISAVHVAVTFVVIVATGNHYVLDAVAGGARTELPHFDQRLTRRSVLHAWHWQRVDELDWSWHVVDSRTLGLGGLTLDQLVRRLAAMPLPRDRPLW